MIDYKYGQLPENQVNDYKKKLHSLVHWLLIYKEENESLLDNYFELVQMKLNGYNELMEYPTHMLEIMNLVESASIKSKEGCTHDEYRRIILDIHALIDKLPPEV